MLDFLAAHNVTGTQVFDLADIASKIVGAAGPPFAVMGGVMLGFHIGKAIYGWAVGWSVPYKVVKDANGDQVLHRIDGDEARRRSKRGSHVVWEDHSGWWQRRGMR